MAHVNVALELLGSKHNLTFTFDNGLPRDFAKFKLDVSSVCEFESLLLQQGRGVAAARPTPVIVEEIERYDPVGRTWEKVTSTDDVPDGAQLYVFQPHTEDDQGRIPPARPAPALPASFPQVSSYASTLPPTPTMQPLPAVAHQTHPVGGAPAAPSDVRGPLSSPGKRPPPSAYASGEGAPALGGARGHDDAAASWPAPDYHHAASSDAYQRPRTLSPPTQHGSAIESAPARHSEMRGAHKPSRIVCIIGVGQDSLGEAIVRWFAEHVQDTSMYAYKVIVCGRDARLLKAMKTEMKDFHFYAVDVLDVVGLESVVDKLSSVHGVPNLVLNAVGVSSPPQALEKIPVAHFDLQIDTVVKGTANVCRAFLPVMKQPPLKQDQQGYEGLLVNLSSNWGRTSVGGHSALCAAKWAVEGLSKSVAQELPHNLACIPVNPGTVNTAGLAHLLGPDRAAEALPAPQWAAAAMPFLLGLGPRDNGRSLTCPGSPEHHFDNALQVFFCSPLTHSPLHRHHLFRHPSRSGPLVSTRKRYLYVPRPTRGFHRATA